MPLWTLFGLRKGSATTPWPGRDHPTGQEGVFGMPRFDAKLCEESCTECAAVCPTEAIKVHADRAGEVTLGVDYGRCVACQLCVEACPTAAATASYDWAFGVRDRSDLILAKGVATDAEEVTAPEFAR